MKKLLYLVIGGIVALLALVLAPFTAIKATAQPYVVGGELVKTAASSGPSPLIPALIVTAIALAVGYLVASKLLK
ncbi:MAG: hypothetical protein GXO09_00955 [Crenarchaeota archaeon]|nr:hypothetical protein [Thermoproteota archaeon]